MKYSKPALIASVIAVVFAVFMATTILVVTVWSAQSIVNAGGSKPDRSWAESEHYTEPDPVTASNAEDFYAQNIHWGSCRADQITDRGSASKSSLSEYQCARLYAPLDWEEPAGEQITLSLAIHRSGSEGAPALFFNLGGPGGASVNSITYQVEDSLGKDLVQKYDIVALDPRGVGESTPLKCLSDAELDTYNATGSFFGVNSKREEETPQEIVESSTRELTFLADHCEHRSGDLFAHIDTVSAAKDFDMVREVLDQPNFNYLGYSYGTFLGATYAELFPAKTGRMVLDGAIDPSMSVNEVSDLQMRGFEDSIGHWMDICLASKSCPFTGDRSAALKQLKDFLLGLDEEPLPTYDRKRPLTMNLALGAVIGTMYSEDTYPVLTQALSSALKDDDGSQLLYIADILNDREDDGSYSSNGTEALIAINNLDYEAAGTIEEWERDAELLKRELPVFGTWAGYASAGLDTWPTSHAQRQEIHAKGSQPIVVVGTTHDPATPYVMAQRLASQLDEGVLVTYDGWGHTAYSKDAGSCVVGAVEGYLLDGTVPQNGLTCSK